MKKIILGLLLFSSVTLANIQDVVKLSGPYSVDKKQAQDSVVHFYLPQNSVAMVGLSGGDKFAAAKDNSGSITTEISENKYTVYINNSLSSGGSSVVGINTICGVSVSVVIHSLDRASKPSQIKPKLSITSPGCKVK